MKRPTTLALLALPLTIGLLAAGSAAPAASTTATPAARGPITSNSDAQNWTLLEKFCQDCHNSEEWEGGVAFDAMTASQIPQDAEIWEGVLEKLRGRLMPPPGNDQPDQRSVDNFVGWLEHRIDTAAAGKPNPGHVPLHRLNRTEYARAVGQLLDLDVDAAALLPKETKNEGFDNIANVLKVSPSFLDQYLWAAREVSVQAVGDARAVPQPTLYRAGPADQRYHVEGLPLGTRGGMQVSHVFPASGEYVFNVGVNAGFGTDVAATVVMTIDGAKVWELPMGGPDEQKYLDQMQVEARKALAPRFRNIKVKVDAGEHTVAVAFLARTYAESDDTLQPFSPLGGMDRIARVATIEIAAPAAAGGVLSLGDTPSRRKIFVCRPASAAEEAPCARRIFAALGRQAFRREITEDDVAASMRFYDAGRRQGGDFDAGVQQGVMAILASPKFLYRLEQAPAGLAPGSVYRLGDLDIASRLSFFLWSQGPDDTLLDLARAGRLHDDAVLRQQVTRMLADPRSDSLVTNFAYQWLMVDKADEIQPDVGLYPDFDATLRAAFRTEIRMFLDSVLRGGHSVTALLGADWTFVNERLAVHYGIKGVAGDRFRRVTLTDPNRFGLLGKGNILMATSYGDRTSPVVRGSWILENLYGTPPHAPPPGVEALKEGSVNGKLLTVRERLELHRTDKTCNSCHGVIDPLGFALENFDTIGAWRSVDRMSLSKIDPRGNLAGTHAAVDSPAALNKALLARPDQFVQNLTRKLMMFALGRTVEYSDMPAIRAIVREAAKDDYRFPALVTAVVLSDAFQMRQIPAAHPEETEAPAHGAAKATQRTALAEPAAPQK